MTSLLSLTAPCVIDGVESQLFEWKRLDVCGSYWLAWKPRQAAEAVNAGRCGNPWTWIQNAGIDRERVIESMPNNTSAPRALKAYPMHRVFTSLDDAGKEIRELIGCDCHGIIVTDAERSFARIVYDGDADRDANNGVYFESTVRTFLMNDATTLVDDIMKRGLTVVLLVAGNSMWFRRVGDDGDGETIEMTSVLKIQQRY
jgi:hypothetical protein